MSVTKPKFLSSENFTSNLGELSPKPGTRCIIHVQRDDDGLWWSLILALLFPVKKRQKFESRLMKLFDICGQQHEITKKRQKDAEDLFDFFEQYNPFLDSQSCFYNAVLKNLVAVFKQRAEYQLNNKRCVGLRSRLLEIAAQTVAVFKQRAECQLNNKLCSDLHSNLLEIAAQLLDCSIVLCDVYQPHIEDFYSSQDKKLQGKVLTLYSEREEGDSKSQFFFHFGIKEQDGKKLQQKALVGILRVACFSEQWITKVNSSLSSDKNIPLSLVQNELYKGIHLLYKQPYILFRLEEAGYVVDPFILNANGENAFSLSIDKKTARAAVYKFYTYMSSTGRNSDPLLHDKLKMANNVLEENRNIFMRRNCEETVTFIEQLIKFNNFRKEIARQFNEINQHHLTTIHYDDMREVASSMEKIIATLSTYSNYFNFEDHVSAPQFGKKLNMVAQFTMEIFRFEKYIPYFEMLDVNAALIMFDNLFFLKQKLKHDCSDLCAYEEIESKFLLFLFACEMYGFSELLYPGSYEGRDERTVRNLAPVTHKLYLHNVLFERRELLHQLTKFRDHIIRRPIELQENTQVFSTLTSVPIIQDVIILRTVIRYLDNVLNIENSATRMKNNSYPHEINKLVTERLLQVLGENLKECSTNNVTLGKSLLVSSFPPETRNDICTIRDTLVHVTEGTNAKNRLSVEKNADIFDGIRDELKYFRFQCEEFLKIMELLLKQDILLRQHSYRGETLQRCYKVAQKDSQVASHLFAGVNADEKPRICHQIENHIHTEEIEKPSAVQCIRIQLEEKDFFGDRCKGHLEVHFDFIEHYMTKAQREPCMREKYQDSISFYVTCIEVLLLQCAYIFTEKSGVPLSSFKKKLTAGLIEVIEIAESYTRLGKTSETDFAELRTKKEHLMRLYDSICNKCSTNRKCLNKEEFRHIGKLSKCLRVYSPLSENEKTAIISSVPQRFKDHSEAKSNLISLSQLISDGQSVQKKAARLQIQRLLPPHRKKILLGRSCNKGNLTELRIPNGIRDPFATLKENLNNDELIKKRDYNDYCTKFGWSEEEKATRSLKKLINGDPFKTKKDVINNQRSTTHFEFLSNRIVALKTLLITSNQRIEEMWLEAKDPKEKMHVKFLIVQKFLSDQKFQAAVEMLLFDCMSIKKNAVHLENLWIKASHLFSGINLRNALAHHNPLIEELGKMLDPDDLATDIISKCLHIVEKAKPTSSSHSSQLSSENHFYLFVTSAFSNNVLSFTFFIIVLLLQPVSTN